MKMAAACTSSHQFSPFKAHKCVAPKCLQGRLFEAKWVKSPHSCVLRITEALPEHGSQDFTFHEHSFPMSTQFASTCGTHLIGRPLIAAVQSNVVLLCYVLRNNPLLQFLVADLRKEILHSIVDGCKYLQSSFYACWSPVECFVSPAGSFIICRLSRELLRSKRSKILYCDIGSVLSKEPECMEPKTALLKEHGLGDWKNQFMAFDPRFPHTAVLLTLKQWKCRIIKADFNTATEANVQPVFYNVSLPRLTSDVFGGQVESDLELQDGEPSDGCGEDIFYQLVSADIDFSRSGGYLFLYGIANCVSSDIDTLDDILGKIVFFVQFSSDNLRPLQTKFYRCAVSSNLEDGKHFLPYLALSPCDTHLHVWILLSDGARCASPKIAYSEMNLRTLRDTCRSVILKHCFPMDVQYLNLPISLKGFLRFEFQYS